MAADILRCMVVSPYVRDLALGVRTQPPREEVGRVVTTTMNLFFAGCATRLFDASNPEGGE